MSVATICNRNVVFIDENAGVIEVASIMREQHVGSVIVVDGAGKPIGMITDRDLVVEVMAKEVKNEDVLLSDIMSENPIVVSEQDDSKDALDKMRAAAVRRAPVIDDQGLLSGILSINDVLVNLSNEMTDIIDLIKSSRDKESANRN